MTEVEMTLVVMAIAPAYIMAAVSWIKEAKNGEQVMTLLEEKHELLARLNEARRCGGDQVKPTGPGFSLAEELQKHYEQKKEVDNV